ncbi:MAG TPA: LacI family DNA-binding transcriptional regulator [Steroidobacteraceae bacterium]|nr:LacI family DNA-binding transcriptional regulator [Steroidobacteraceae bacterium]
MTRRKRSNPATIKDVAHELGMSVATVSRALSRPQLLRPETRERVMDAVERLGYRPNLMARGLRQGLANAILFVAPNLSPFFLEIFAGAEAVTRDSQFSLLFGNSNGDLGSVQHFFEQITSGKADGIILLTGVAPDGYAAGERQLPPLITVLERLPGAVVPVVHTDHFAGAQEAVRHLVELGHRRIAHIAGLRRVPSAIRRLEGYRTALAAAGVPATAELIETGDFTMSSGAAAMMRLLALPQPPTAVFCSNDEMAYGAIRAVVKMGLSVPEDVSVVGFDDQNLAEFYNPPLTTVAVPRHELGRRAAQELIDQLAGRDVAREVVLPTRLVVRESTAPPTARRPGSRVRHAKRNR